MPRGKKKKTDDGPPGAPEWMVTFSDCMTLLLTFFVLLLSFSSFDEQTKNLLRGVSAEAMPSLELRRRMSRKSLLSSQEIFTPEEMDTGSEKPTLDAGIKNKAVKETSGDFYSRKVFITPSSNIFWGKGTSISTEGRKILADASDFLKSRPGRIIISEYNPEGGLEQSLARSYQIMQTLTEQYGMDKKRMSISTVNTAPRIAAGKHSLQIVILDKELY